MSHDIEAKLKELNEMCNSLDSFSGIFETISSAIPMDQLTEEEKKEVSILQGKIKTASVDDLKSMLKDYKSKL